ncbi:hypothetical protein IWQ60_008982 [Tieghemiomyces parasiticus]|uniref:Cyclin N-terminal domain-containing protein n=1 Tax=Tieghemiomyces parasiticus TaxID=78921 RepID=A0A9W8DLZ0_9FUNG|nr:hypothetical protein IWQ60_008982 [Tieghemiomyces parasiticus]
MTAATAGMNFLEENRALLNLTVNSVNSVLNCQRVSPYNLTLSLKRCSDEVLAAATAAAATAAASPPPQESSASGAGTAPLCPPVPSALLLPPLDEFVRSTCSQLRPSFLTLVSSLVYVERLREMLPATARGSRDTPYRIFLAALMVSDKFLHDNKAFRTRTVADATRGAFNVQQVNRMEATFMSLMRYRLWIKADELEAFLLRNGLTYPPAASAE